MKNKDAVKVLENLRFATVLSGFTDEPEDKEGTKLLLEALETAIECIKNYDAKNIEDANKNVAVEPLRPYDFMKVLNPRTNKLEEYVCANCTCGYTLLQNTENRYCPNCGQKFNFNVRREADE